MKDKVLMLIIGMLIGAVITAGGFLIFSKNTTNNNPGMNGGKMNMGNYVPGDMQNGGGRGNKNGNFVDMQQKDMVTDENIATSNS